MFKLLITILMQIQIPIINTYKIIALFSNNNHKISYLINMDIFNKIFKLIINKIMSNNYCKIKNKM